MHDTVACGRKLKHGEAFTGVERGRIWDRKGAMMSRLYWRASGLVEHVQLCSLVTRRLLLDVGLRKTLTRPTEQPSGIFGQSGVPLNHARECRLASCAGLKTLKNLNIFFRHTYPFLNEF